MSDDLMQNNQRCQPSHRTTKKEACLPSHKSVQANATETSPDLANAVVPGAKKQHQIKQALNAGSDAQQITEQTAVKERTTVAAAAPKIDPYADFVQPEQKSLFGRLTGFVSDKFTSTMKSIASVRDNIVNTVSNVTSGIGEKLTAAKNTVVDAVASIIPEPIKVGFGNFTNGLKAFANNPISTIVSSFSSAFSAITRSAMNVASSAMKMLGFGSKAPKTTAETIQAALAQESARQERERIFELTSATKMGEHLAEAEAIKKLQKANAVATFGPTKEKSVYDRVDNGPEKPKTVAEQLEDLEKGKKARSEALAALAKARDLSRLS